MLGIEGPDVEVLDAVALVHVVQGSALARGPAQEAHGVPARAGRIPREQLRLGVGGQRGESKQVSYFDPRERPIRTPGHAAILSRRVPIHIGRTAPYPSFLGGQAATDIHSPFWEQQRIVRA
jgi:hypothetical protein